MPLMIKNQESEIMKRTRNPVIVEMVLFLPVMNIPRNVNKTMPESRPAITGMSSVLKPMVSTKPMMYAIPRVKKDENVPAQNMERRNIPFIFP